MKNLTWFIGFLLLAGCAARNPEPASVESNPPLYVAGTGTNATVTLAGKDARLNPYDAAIIRTVNQKWDELLKSHRFAWGRTGKVVVQFHLHPDGSVSDLKVSENSAGVLPGYVCEEAVMEAAPFGSWPPDMVREAGGDHREVSFTFYYN